MTVRPKQADRKCGSLFKDMPWRGSGGGRGSGWRTHWRVVVVFASRIVIKKIGKKGKETSREKIAVASSLKAVERREVAGGRNWRAIVVFASRLYKKRLALK